VGSAAALAAKPGGACAWLLSLRSADVTASACCAALRALPGVGPKVSACAALFSLEKHDLVPVDTHVWQLAQAHYAHALPPEALAPPKAANEADESAPDAEFDVAADPMSSPGGTAASGATPGGGSGAKKKKSGSGDGFTLRRGAAVEAALARLFGPYAGWAQTALFVAELRQQKAQLPEHLRTPATGGGTPGTASAQRKKATPKAETQADGAKKRAPKRKLESGEAA
jgi:3-methyladenine DNA glycosylase/8-oxoguanine DNA glycosylase